MYWLLSSWSLIDCHQFSLHFQICRLRRNCSGADTSHMLAVGWAVCLSGLKTSPPPMALFPTVRPVSLVHPFLYLVDYSTCHLTPQDSCCRLASLSGLDEGDSGVQRHLLHPGQNLLLGVLVVQPPNERESDPLVYRRHLLVTVAGHSEVADSCKTMKVCCKLSDWLIPLLLGIDHC